MSARTHSHVSNRAKVRDGNDRKPVFQSVLDNPFRIPWPSVPLNVQNSVLALLISTMSGISQYHKGRDTSNRKRKRSQKAESNKDGLKKRKTDVEMSDATTSTTDSGTCVETPINTQETLPTSEPDPPPALLGHLTIGINEVTKRLESQIRNKRHRLVLNREQDALSSPSKPRPAIKLVFICRADIDPPILIDHFPHLIAALNSPSQMPTETFDPVKIVPLPRGAEASLAEVLGLRRVAILAMDVETPQLSLFASMLESVPTLTASWLATTATMAPANQLLPTHIKQVRTSAPKDMKAAKERRAEEKSTAKARRKSRPDASLRIEQSKA